MTGDPRPTPVFFVTVASVCPICQKDVTHFRFGADGLFAAHADGSKECLAATNDPDLLALAVAELEGEA